MNLFHSLCDWIRRLCPQRESSYTDPFDDEDIELIGRDRVDETTTIDYPIPGRVLGNPITTRVLVLSSSGPILELDETLYELSQDELRANIPHSHGTVGSWDVRVRFEWANDADQGIER